MSLTQSQLIDIINLALGALADIGLSDDMTLEVARRKANRIALEIRKRMIQ